ncbi:MAG TPA: hypothetical protein VGB85_00235 [Nannocystis sp.]
MLLALVASCSAPDIKPTSGTWTYTDIVQVSSTCAGEMSAPGGDFTVTVLGEDRFTIGAEGLENPLDCNYGDNTFDCPETLLFKFTSDTDDSELIVTVEIEGTLVSSTELEGREVIRQSCTGADCAKVIADGKLTLPCETTLSFTGLAK